MCGRYVLKTPIQNLEQKYDADLLEDFPFTSDYNVAPSRTMPVILEKDGNRKIAPHRWGLIPFWAKSVNTGYSMINARAESLDGKKSFSKPFRSQRCIIPANGFYEWQKTSGGKIPHFITLKSSELMNFAGLYEHWKSPDGEIINSYTIITTEANKPMAQLHDRMPAMLLDDELKIWLDSQNEDTAMLRSMLKPWPDDDITFYRVAQEVNNVRNNGEQLIEPYRDLFS
jgi:putative SOS response-associated peptidase YedK